MPCRRNTFGPKPPRVSAQLARAQALTAKAPKALRVPPRAAGPDPCAGAVPRRLQVKGGGR